MKKKVKKKTIFFVHSMKMLNLSLNELRQIAKMRSMKGYKSMSEERLLSSINKSESVKNFNGARIENFKRDFNKFRDRLFKPKIKEIRKDLYRIENTRTKEIEKNPLKLENNLFKLKNYHDYDDIKYKGIRDARNLFRLSIDEDYYESIRTNSFFNHNYVEYWSKGDKNKTLSVKEYLTMIKPYLRDIINDHKTQGNGKFIQVMK